MTDCAGKTSKTNDAEWWQDLQLSQARASEPDPTDNETYLTEEARALAATLRHRRLDPGSIVAAVALLDLVLVWATAFAVQIFTGNPASPETGALFALVAGVATVVCLGLAKSYTLRRLAHFAEAALGVLAVWIALAMAAVLTKPWGDATPAVVMHLAAAVAAVLVAGRLAVSGFVRWCLAARITERRAAIVGGGGNADRLIRGLERQPDNDIRIVAMFDDRGDDRSPPLVANCRKIGTVADLTHFARIAELDMLIVTLPLSAEHRIRDLLSTLWVLPIDIRLSAYSEDYTFKRRSGEETGGLIGIAAHPLPWLRRQIKRGVDIGLALVALTVASPVMLATAVAIRLDSPGPILFRQERHGFNHRPIKVLKFRSMYHDQCDARATNIVQKGDPRVTPVGRIIRKLSIDELPQLFNVLKGDLSMVGPRPHAIDARSARHELFTHIVDGYSGRHRFPPGITGWAQINGWRGGIEDPEALRQRFEHDLYYIENWSIWLDLKIMLLTPFRLFDTSRAY